MRWIEAAHEPGAVLWVGDVLPYTDRRTGWPLVHGLYQQIVKVREGGSRPVPDELREALVDAIAQVSLGYVGQEAQMCELALAAFAAADGHEGIGLDLRRGYYYEDDGVGGCHVMGSVLRRRPSTYEALVETCRRRRDARDLRDAMRSTGTSGLIIGSTSYGPFVNVRGNRPGGPASDLDVIVFIEEAAALPIVAQRLGALPGVMMADVDYLLHRARLFVDCLDDGKTIFSHKVRLWLDGTPDLLLPVGLGRADYVLSLHFMTPSVLKYVLVEASPLLAKNSMGSRRTIRDYREVVARREDCVFTFERRGHHLPLQATRAEEGYVTFPSVCHFDDFGSYCPGFYQTMLFPPWDLLWDDRNVQLALKEFWGKITDRVRSEAARQEHAMLRPSFAHVRREVLSPRVIAVMDEGYWRS